MPPTSPQRSPVLRACSRFAALALCSAAILVSGCSEDGESPTAPAVGMTQALAAAGPLSFRQISTGNEHACGVTTDDLAYCWGSSGWGQLGDGSESSSGGTGEECNTHPCRSRPVAVAGGLHFRHVSAGSQHTCGLTTGNRVYCWGGNSLGELGTGSQTGTRAPVPIAGTRQFRQVRAGGSTTCAITMANAAFCWGNNNWGQLGDGTTTMRLRPVPVAGAMAWKQLSVGGNHTCGITQTNRAYCWGRNAGALGNGTTTQRELRPVAVTGGLQFLQIEAGATHTCAVATAENRAYCWGTGSSGELGDGVGFKNSRPSAVLGNRRFDNVSAGIFHSCGVTVAGRGFCWGNNASGQLGDGTQENRKKPVALAVSLDLVQISAGNVFSCAVSTGNRAYCWGDNFSGQLGDGTTNNHFIPQPVAGAM